MQSPHAAYWHLNTGGRSEGTCCFVKNWKNGKSRKLEAGDRGCIYKVSTSFSKSQGKMERKTKNSQQGSGTVSSDWKGTELTFSARMRSDIEVRWGHFKV